MSEFADKYGPWALIVGVSDGIGSSFAEQIAEWGVNVVLVARRQRLLEEVSADIVKRTGVAVRTLSVVRTAPTASADIVAETSDIAIGLLVPQVRIGIINASLPTRWKPVRH